MSKITLTTPLKGPAVGTFAQINTFAAAHPSAKSQFTSSMLSAIYQLAPKASLRPDIVAARSALETGNWLADLYLKYGNPGGLGKFPDGTYVGGIFPSPVIAAKAMLAHFVAYVYGESINADTAEWAQYDPRWQPAIDLVAEKGTISTVGEFGNGMWATSATDAPDLVKRFNDIFDVFTLPVEPGGPQMPTTKLFFHRAPVPESLQLHDIVSDGPNTAFDRLGERGNYGTFTHRMVGSLLGTHGYFQGDAKNRSLTDFGIGGTWDGANDGVIYQWVPKGLAIAPWASGPANDLEGDGIAFVQALGVNAVNRDMRAIELSDGGNYLAPWGPVAQKLQYREYIALMVYLFDDAEVPWDSYPVNPEVGVVTDLEHWEIGPKECPFAPVRDQINVRQADIRAGLKMYQTGVGTTPDPIPAGPPVIPPYSASLDQNFLREQWGAPRRVYVTGTAAKDDDGNEKTYPWSPKWTPCSAWIYRCKRHNAFPSPGDWESIPNANKDKGEPTSMITFENGWALLHFNDARGWRWAGDESGDVD